MTASTVSTASSTFSCLRLLALLSASALALACGGGEEPAPAASTQASAARPKPIAVTALKKAAKPRDPADHGTEIPIDFPGDIPFAEGAETRNVRVAPRNNGTMVMLVTGQSPNSVRSYYRAALPEKGWKIESLDDVDGITLISANKPGRTLTVIVEPENDGALISLISAN